MTAMGGRGRNEHDLGAHRVAPFEASRRGHRLCRDAGVRHACRRAAGGGRQWCRDTGVATPVAVTFATVDEAGVTSLFTNEGGPELPTGLAQGDGASRYFQLSTTAVTS